MNDEKFQTKYTKDMRDFMSILARPRFSAPPAFARLDPCICRGTLKCFPVEIIYKLMGALHFRRLGYFLLIQVLELKSLW